MGLSWVKYEFRANWLDNVCFRLWLCSIAKEKFQLVTMGITALYSLLQCEKHKTAANCHKQTPEMLQFLPCLIVVQQDAPNILYIYIFLLLNLIQGGIIRSYVLFI